MGLEQRGIKMSEEVWAAIDAARGDEPRGPWLERFLASCGTIRKGAKTAGVTLPKRPVEGRGKWERPKSEP